MGKYIIILLMNVLLVSCYSNHTVLLYEVSQENANQIILELANNGIKAQKELQKDNTFNVLVEPSLQTKALSVLEKFGGIKQDYTNLGLVFKKDGFISSPLEEHARLEYALDQEISAMLSSINGVISIHTEVGLPIPNDNLWQADTPKPVIAVLIKYSEGSQVNLYTNRIKELLSHSVPGVTPNQVNVLMIEQKNDARLN